MSDISTKLVALYNSRDHDEVLTISLAEIERLHDQTNAYRADIEREVTAHVTTIQTLNQQDAEIERLEQMVRDAAQALNDEERENERLRGLLREFAPYYEEYDDDFQRRVREALGDE
jgi:Skp family chaperone for outer membrane proteins